MSFHTSGRLRFYLQLGPTFVCQTHAAPGLSRSQNRLLLIIFFTELLRGWKQPTVQSDLGQSRQKSSSWCASRLNCNEYWTPEQVVFRLDIRVEKKKKTLRACCVRWNDDLSRKEMITNSSVLKGFWLFWSISDFFFLCWNNPIPKKTCLQAPLLLVT